MSNEYDVNADFDLSAYDEDYQNEEVKISTPPPSDGYYEAVIESVTLKPSKTGSPMVAWYLRVTGPQHAGHLCRVYNVIPAGMGFLKKNLAVCKLEIESLSELPDKLPTLEGLRLNVKVQHRVDNPELPNVYFNYILEQTSEQALASDDAEDDDDIPI